ncbi:hypothetical protein Mycsm_00753 [Mycobacterium sp. JS623]|uniref:septum formation family protein n=1 Tax=Mycobacterium sp. JS623 TaxID=212767 RepID=UPI0002A5B37D|nr:septum formation family protein [Mycobacterium sp. JS623]AGB21193.1 hypothetical protein Mycsm_00753 [Mycobacterium sp. JS623]
MSVKRGSDEVSTDKLPVHHSRACARPRRTPLPLWSMRVLFITVAVAVVAASAVVVWQMTNRSNANAPTAEVRRGDCLTWPPGQPEHATKVDCADEHLFEVADSEPIPAAGADDQQTCARAVGYYLGPHYDPGGRFVAGAVQTAGWLLCGLQLPSDGIASFGFKGKVDSQDQSRVWATGTCLGIRDGKTTDIAVDCGLPHALEITGTADLSTVFGQAAPSTAAQDAVVRDVCGVATSAYLSPLTLDATGLSVRYQPIDAAGWAAGSHRVACRIGSPRPDGGWATLVRSARNGVRIAGQPISPPPSPVQPLPVEVAAPTTESEPSPPEEVPVRVDIAPDESTDESTVGSVDAAGSVPHMDGSEGLGPVQHIQGPGLAGPVPYTVGPPAPRPAPESPSAQPLPDSGSPSG